MREICNYCNPEKPKVFLFARTPYGTIQGFISANGILDMDYPGGLFAKRINYCPVCGRKLAQTSEGGGRREWDPSHPHCRECLCQDCWHFQMHDGDCREGCDECDGESHTGFCPMFEEAEA